MYSTQTFQNNTKAEHQTLLLIKQHKVKAVIIWIALIAGLHILYTYTNSYESEAQILFNDYLLPDIQQASPVNGVEAIFIKSISLNRVNGIVNSQKMMEYLDKKYQLAEHYDISRSDSLNMSILYKILYQRISIGLVNFPGNLNRIYIRVRDTKSPALCTAIANDIAQKVKEENLRMINFAIEKKQKLNHAAAEQLYLKYQKLLNDMTTILGELKNPGLIKQTKNDQWENLSNQFSETMINLRVQTEALKEFEKSNNSLESNTFSFPEIEIVKPALTDKRGTNIPYKYYLPISIVASIFFTFLLFFIYIQAKNLLQIAM